ncbi:hypothetical protein FGRMN_3025 [Fusarium graminum]|nr:hypothetical protein FGRMN_3025 [Fusarium graminum]
MLLDDELLRRVPLPEDIVGLLARGQIEQDHRTNLWNLSVADSLQPCTLLDSACSKTCHHEIRDISDKHARDCCNKTVPVYILPSVLESSSLLPMALHNWLYRKWFKPFQSDLEFGQFIAKCFVPRHLPRNMSGAQLVETIHQLNDRICQQVIEDHHELALEPLGINMMINKNIKDRRFYVLQPLFQAMAIALRVDDFDIEELDMGKMPVLLTLTGVDSGLSEPLSLVSVKDKATSILSDTAIEVSLEVAIDFVLDLEKRELAVFGLRPDPVASTANYRYGCGICNPWFPASMRILGWRGPIEGPSSRWVDADRYTEWIGKGADLDRDLYEEECKERSRLLTEDGMARAKEMIDALLE